MSLESLVEQIEAEFVNLEEPPSQKNGNSKDEAYFRYYNLYEKWRKGKLEFSKMELKLFNKIMKDRGKIGGVEVEDFVYREHVVEAILIVKACKDIDVELTWW